MGSQDNKRLAQNTAFLYFRMFFAIIIGLYTSRVVLNTLGVVDYGVYNVVGGFVGLFSFLTNSLASSMQRYYNYEGIADIQNGYSRVLTCGIVIHFAFSLILLAIFETMGIWYVNNVAVIPTERMYAANFVLQTVAISSILTMMTSPYAGIIMAKERMDFAALVGIGDILLRLILVILLPIIPYDKLIIFSIISLIVTAINFISNVVYCRFQFPEIRVYFNKQNDLYRKLLSFTGWNIIGTFALMSKGQGINMLLNFFFGPVINAARGIAYQVNTALSNFYYNVATAFRPQIVDAFAKGDNERTRNLMYIESKICFVLILLLITPVIVEINYVLHLWLGDVVPKHTPIFTALILIETLVYTLHTPCSQVVQAVGFVKKFQIINTVINLSILPVSWILLLIGFEAEIVFIVNIIFAIINTVWCLIYTNKIFYFNLKQYLREVMIPCGIMSLLAPVFPVIVSEFFPESFLRLIISFVSSAAILAISSYFVILRNNEKVFVKQIIKSLLK